MNTFQREVFEKYSGTSHSFGPTLNVFKNGIVINYKKVGTRFIEKIVNADLYFDRSFDEGDIAESPDNKQIDVNIVRDFKIGEKGIEEKLSELGITVNNSMGAANSMYDRFIMAPWHRYLQDFIRERDFDFSDVTIDDYKSYLIGRTDALRGPGSHPLWYDDKSFLTQFDAESYSDLFFKPKTDIYFLIRDPLERFFSGVIQVLRAYITQIEYDGDLFAEFQRFSELSNADIVNALRHFGGWGSGELPSHLEYIFTENLPELSIIKMINFMLVYKLDLIIQDVHTENYLSHYKDIILSIEDKSKIKVIDLSQFNSHKSLQLVDHLRGDDLATLIFQKFTENRESNRRSYTTGLEAYLNNTLGAYSSYGRDSSFIDVFLKEESLIYNDLIQSEYFIDLTDEAIYEQESENSDNGS